MKTVEIRGLGTAPGMGMGCMGMSEFYGPAQNEQESLRLLLTAYEYGVRMFDTADFYGDGANERLLGKLLNENATSEAIIATKCGIKRGSEIMADGNFRREFDGSPEWITQCAEASLKRLGVETLDMFYLHRVDPKVAIEESAGAMARLIERGLIRTWGVSEADADTLKRAHSVQPLSAVQSEFSLWYRDLEADVIPLCQELGITFVAYAPLGRGIIPQKASDAVVNFAEGDFRRTLERAQPETLSKNASLYSVLEQCGAELSSTPFQVMLAWVLGSHPNVLAIPGMRRLSSLEANVEAARLELPSAIRERLNNAFGTGQVSGGRYTVDPGVSESFAATN